MASPQPPPQDPIDSHPVASPPPPAQAQHEPKGNFQPYDQYSSSYGQPFQPYQPYPQHQQQQMQPQQLGEQVAGPPLETKKWMWTKIGFHVANIIFCICGFGIGLSMIGGGYWTDSSYIALACCPLFGVSALWSIAEVVTRLVRKWKAGIHPGAHVGVCLVLWLAAVIVVGIVTTLLVIYSGRYYTSGECEDSWGGPSSYYDDDYAERYCHPFGGHKASFVAVAVFTYMTFLFNLFFFIGACVDTAKRNRAARTRPVIMVASPQYWATQNQGYQTVPNSFYAPQTTAGYAAPQQFQQQQQHQQQHQQQQQPQPQNGQYMGVPSQDIPLQTRSTSPRNQELAAHTEAVASGSGSDHHHQHHHQHAAHDNVTSPGQQGVTEFYTPAGSR